jgi:hypothetical protein
MKHDVQVSAIFNSGFGMELEMIHIKTSDGEVTLNKDQYEEIERTLECKRETACSSEFDGFYPKQMFVWN